MPATGSKLSVLLVEDEALIRMMIAEMLEDLGHHVVAETSRIDAALRLAETAKFDLALLDVNVAGSSILPVDNIIERRGFPILFVSGYATTGLPEPFGSRGRAA
jgi:CheY-like chemotaxis protein